MGMEKGEGRMEHDTAAPLSLGQQDCHVFWNSPVNIRSRRSNIDGCCMGGRSGDFCTYLIRLDERR